MEKYLKAKRRAEKVLRNKEASDAEIIEYLESEIQYYRNEIKEMRDRNIQNKIEDAIEITTEERYADGELIQTIINYKY